MAHDSCRWFVTYTLYTVPGVRQGVICPGGRLVYGRCLHPSVDYTLCHTIPVLRHLQRHLPLVSTLHFASFVTLRWLCIYFLMDVVFGDFPHGFDDLV
jgi:hypothetical protein